MTEKHRRVFSIARKMFFIEIEKHTLRRAAFVSHKIQSLTDLQTPVEL